MKVFHASLEGAQHGPKGLIGFLKLAKSAGAKGCQPSNFQLEQQPGVLMPASRIKQAFCETGLSLDGISAHCPFWVQTTAWTESKTIRPFLAPEIARLPVEKIEQWAEDYCSRLLDLCAELNVKIVPMFWGTAYGWEVATGYPWGFWSRKSKDSDPGRDLDYDLVTEGDERFVSKTRKIRDHARNLNIKLCHEIHNGTAAICAKDFLHLMEICDDDPCLGVNADPSHCDEGEDWRTRFELVGKHVWTAHVKNFIVRQGMPLRCMQPNFQNRAKQFTPLHLGRVPLTQYAELLLQIGYAKRYCQIQKTLTAPLVGEAEAAWQDLDQTSEEGVEFIRRALCFDLAQESFEKGMGATKE